MARSFGRPRFREILVKILFVSLTATAVCAAQSSPPAQQATPAGQARGATNPASANSQKIYVVLPFENAGAPARLDWLGEGLEELTIQRLTAAGEQVYSHSGRANELERYGLPSSSTDPS